jgi:diguanylate cyclase (GGDEF)-like protein
MGKAGRPAFRRLVSLRNLFGPGPVQSHFNDEGLVQAYATNLSRRLPLIYSVVIIDQVVLATRFEGLAPAYLTLWMPLALSLLFLWRGIYWLPYFLARRSQAQIARDLTVMSRLGGVFALLTSLWALALYPWGDHDQQSLVQYIVAVSCYATILGLGHSPRTALSVGLSAMLPTTMFFLLQSHPNAMQISIVQSVVTGLLLAATNGYHRDFVRLELSRQQIARREREAAKLAESNHYNATIDPLTGALNRRAVLARLESELGEAGAAPWLALLDLDGFKHVNDTYGHAAGDSVLRAVSDRIADMDDLVAFGRLGGDEFAILLDASRAEGEITETLACLCETIRQPIDHNGVTLRLAGSIGYCLADAGDVSQCLERSDAALYKAKEKGEGGIVRFTDHDEQELTRRSAATRRFNDCSLEDRLRLVYQPVIDIDTGSYTGFEAFARWSPDGEEWLTPSSFLSLAQATGRTGELTRLVLARALAECPAWEHGRDLAINLSPRDVMREAAPEAFAAIVREAGAPPESIILEITERAVQTDPRRAIEQLARFRAKGFRIALDDFGVGWSSLSNVRDLPLDRLKIDRALSSALVEDPGARAIGGTIVGLAWQMGLECTAEGIENERQAETARALGVRLMQGFHFCRPTAAQEVLGKMARAA